MSEREKESEKGMMKKEADDSELSGVTIEGDSDDIAWGFEIRKNELVAKLMELTGEIDESDVPPSPEDFVKAFEEEVARKEAEGEQRRSEFYGKLTAVEEKDPLTSRINAIVLEVCVGLAVIFGAGIYMHYKDGEDQMERMCGMFQKGIPLMREEDQDVVPYLSQSLGEIAKSCKNNSGIAATKECIARSIADTVGSTHNLDLISRDLAYDMFVVGAKCNQK